MSVLSDDNFRCAVSNSQPKGKRKLFTLEVICVMFSKRVKSYALTCNENELRKGKNAKSGRGLQGVLRIRKKNEMKIEPIRFDSICH